MEKGGSKKFGQSHKWTDNLRVSYKEVIFQVCQSKDNRCKQETNKLNDDTSMSKQQLTISGNASADLFEIDY